MGAARRLASGAASARKGWPTRKKHRGGKKRPSQHGLGGAAEQQRSPRALGFGSHRGAADAGWWPDPELPNAVARGPRCARC